MKRPLSNDHLTQIQRLWETKETEYLVEVWERHDTQEWPEEVFTIIREILLERSVELPDHAQETQVSNSSELISQAGQHLKKAEEYLDAGEMEYA